MTLRDAVNVLCLVCVAWAVVASVWIHFTRRRAAQLRGFLTDAERRYGEACKALTADDAILSIVQEMGCTYHPDMTLPEVTHFIGALAEDYRHPRRGHGIGVVYVATEYATTREIWRLEIVKES